MGKLQESIENLERQSSPVEELSQVLTRADNFLHFVLQNAPVVIGHQFSIFCRIKKKYRFIFNHFPSLGEQDIIGKTDVEIFSGAGVKESQDFKREQDRETIGVNYMGMEVTDQVRKREKMAKLRGNGCTESQGDRAKQNNPHNRGIDASKTNAGNNVS
ncbi:UNVERIFIED_CONTAM: Histidine kinase [Sesamum calycinum]|uniref:Histidine kinase n=1 Tax=Sesamum calycinum TaxID=2727403 RepID=A0AAW2QW99_9LAMI